MSLVVAPIVAKKTMPNDLKLTQEFYHSLKRFILSKVSNPDDAQDILHDALAKAVSRINALRDNTKVTAWLYQIIRSSIVDFYRKKKPSEDYDDNIGYNKGKLSENDNKIMSSCLKGIMQTLPEKERSVLEAVEFKNVSQIDLSKHLGLSNSGAKSRVQRARKKLKEKLYQCCQIQTDTRGNVIHYVQRNQKACCESCN